MKKSGGLWNLPYVMLLVIGVFTSATNYMVNPNLPEYLTTMGASLTLTASITSIVSGVAMVCRPFSGAANDLFNRKKLMIISTVATAVCLFGYSLAPNLGILVAVRVMHGVAFAVYGTTNMAFATSFIPKDKMGEGLGYLTLGTVLSSTVGPSLGIWMVDALGMSACFITCGCMSLLSVLVIMRLPYVEPEREEPERLEGRRMPRLKFSNLFAKEILVYAILIGIFSGGNAIESTFIKLLAQERGLGNIGLFFTFNSLVLVLVRPLGGKLNDRKGLAFMLYPAYILSAIGMFMVAGAQSLWVVLLAGMIRSVGQGAGAPAIQAASIRRLGVARSGVAISTCYIFQDLAHTLFPIVGGAVADEWSYTVMFAGFGIVLLLADLGYFLYRRAGGEAYLLEEKNAQAAESAK